MKAIIGEFLGTMILVLLGDGACCNTWLTGSGMKSKNNTQLIIGWGAAVMLPAFIFGDISGSHFNPAITIASAIRGAFPWSQVPGYIIAQLLGGFCGAVLLLIIFHDHIKQPLRFFLSSISLSLDTYSCSLFSPFISPWRRFQRDCDFGVIPSPLQGQGWVS